MTDERKPAVRAIVRRTTRGDIEEALDGIAKVAPLLKYIPATGPLAIAFEKMSGVVQASRKRREEARAKALLHLVEVWAKQPPDAPAPTEEQVDLYEQVIATALMDDEAEKTPIYGAMITLIQKREVMPVQVRMIVDALATLSYAELYVWPNAANGIRPERTFHNRVVEEQAFWNRMDALGLSTGGVDMNPNVTSLGTIVGRMIPPSLPLPRELRDDYPEQ